MIALNLIPRPDAAFTLRSLKAGVLEVSPAYLLQSSMQYFGQFFNGPVSLTE